MVSDMSDTIFCSFGQKGRLKSTQKKNKKVSVRFTESEYEEMKRHRGDKTTSAYLKGLIAKSKAKR